MKDAAGRYVPETVIVDASTGIGQSFGPSANFQAITPSDATDLSTLGIRAIYVAGAGTVVATPATGADVTFTCQAGAVLLINPKKIKAASSATGIVALL
jgi:hypothetical protein